jgi:hypothetical protein
MKEAFTTEDAELARRLIFSLCKLCALCVSVVKNTPSLTQVQN